MSNRSRNLFLEACGAAVPFRLAVEYLDSRETLYRTFALPFAVIGRDPQADLILDDPAVNPRHVYVQMIAGRLWCVDLGSRTGVLWEDGSVEPGWLEGSRALRIGPFRIRRADTGPGVVAGAQTTFNPLASHTPEAAALPRITLEFISNPGAHRPYTMTRVLTLVGQAPGCKIRLVSSTVARFHCSLLRTVQGLWAVDLLGNGGIAVANGAVAWARLDENDQLKVGKFVLRVSYRTLTDPGPAAGGTRGKKTILADAPSVEPPGYVSGPDPEPIPPLWSMSGRVQPLSLQGPILADTPDVDVPALASGRMLGSPELVQAVLIPLANQFSVMQQQMFDQFQQALLGVVQMFSGLHKEQFALIRQELDRLHELNRDMLTLQAELAKRPAPSAEPPVLSASLVRSGSAANGAIAMSTPGQANVGPETPLGAPENGALSPLAAAPAKANPDQLPPAQTNRAAEPLSVPLPPTTHPEQTERDVHAWLEQRLATIQEERQSRWRKILNFVLGKRGDSAR